MFQLPTTYAPKFQIKVLFGAGELIMKSQNIHTRIIKNAQHLLCNLAWWLVNKYEMCI